MTCLAHGLDERRDEIVHELLQIGLAIHHCRCYALLHRQLAVIQQLRHA